MRKTHKGYFRPENPGKYKGDANNIVYRSGWELKFMKTLDRNPSVVSWMSEETIVPYRCPASRKTRRYFPDFVVDVKLPEGTIQTTMIEIKPEYQTQKPVLKESKKRRTFVREAVTYAINQAKWSAAKAYCATKGWEFRIYTEKQLGIK